MHADAQGDARPAGGELLDDLQVDLVGLAAAADVLAEGQAEQPRLAQRPERLAREALLPLELRGVRRQLGVGQFAGQREEVVGLTGGQFAVDRHGSPSVETVLKTVPQYCSASSGHADPPGGGGHDHRCAAGRRPA